MTPSNRNPTPAATPVSAARLRTLAELIGIQAPRDGVHTLRLPGVYAVRRSRVTTDGLHASPTPMLCIVAQGAKVVMLGREVYEYSASRMLVFSVQLPVSGQVVRASRNEPFLGLSLDLDPSRVAELAQRVFPKGLPRTQNNRGLYVGPVTEGIADAALRLLKLIADGDDADILGPLVVDEIIIRLLKSSIGNRVAQIGKPNSHVHLVGRAISFLRDNFAQPVTVEQLAKLVHMSESSFHNHFKSVTSMSPLQYQKTLRLLEARRLLLSGVEEASEAADRVGYLSRSQFSREYARVFGSAPIKDVARLRAQGVVAATASRSDIRGWQRR